MTLFSELRERLDAALHRRLRAAETDAELRFHVEMETEKNLRSGMDPQEARRQALIAFGAVERYREEVREARGLGWLDLFGRDVRYAWRSLRLNRAFTGTLMLTLALGIGASAVMFSIVDALLLRPLPYHDPAHLVEAFSVRPGGEARGYVGWPAAREWRERSQLFTGSFSHVRQNVLLTGSGDPRTIIVEGVTSGMGDVLGVHVALGRGLLPEDAEPGAPGVIVLENGFWRSGFGGDPGVVGREIEIEGARQRVVGVMPAGFKFPEYAHTEGWMPIRTDGSFLGHPTEMLYFVGRIRTPIETAQSRADAFARRLAAEQPREGGWSVRLQPLGTSRGNSGQLRQSVTLLVGSVILLLLVASVNVTSLLLVRGWSRARELAVRVALGASRRRIVAQLITESLVITLLSGVAATLLALAALRALRGIIPESITFFAPFPITLEWRTVGFTFALAAVVAAVTGVVPAIRITRSGLAAAEGGLTPYATQTAGANRLRRVLVAGEIGLSVVLLTGAGLLLRSFAALVSVDPGFRVEGVAVMKMSVSEAGYPTPASRMAYLREVEQRIEAIPGVQGVALNGNVPPNAGWQFGVQLEAEGSGGPAVAQPPMLPFANVPPDFFSVLGVRLNAGRPFDARDVGTDHAIIDAGLAHLLWNGANPIGRRFRLGPDVPWKTVTGVVEDLRMAGPDDRMGSFEVLYPLDAAGLPSYTALAIRTRGDPSALFPAIRRALHEVDPRQPIETLATARDLYAATMDMPRFLVILMGALSALALVLGAVGIYGVLSFTVVGRRREIAIRGALGAPLGAAQRRVLGEGLLLAVCGVTGGIAIAIALSRLIEGVLYHVRPADPATLGVVGILTLVSAALASYLPARHAARIDPIELLRLDGS